MPGHAGRARNWCWTEKAFRGCLNNWFWSRWTLSNLVMLSKPSSNEYIPSVLQRHHHQHSISHVYSGDSSAAAPVETHRLTTCVGETLHRQRQLSSRAAKIRETWICAGDCFEGARTMESSFSSQAESSSGPSGVTSDLSTAWVAPRLLRLALGPLALGPHTSNAPLFCAAS